MAKICLLLIVSLSLMHGAYSQDKKQLILADQYFSGGEYLTAAGLYGQYLNSKNNPASDFPLHSKRSVGTQTFKLTSRNEIILKQAESYRLAHYWKEALALYEGAYAADQQKNLESLYWMAVCQRNLGNVTSAEENIMLFLNAEISDNFRQLAEKEKQTLDFIKQQKNRPDTVLYQINRITGDINGGEGMYAPYAFGQKEVYFTGIEKDSVSTAGTNPNHNRIFQSVMSEGMLQDIKPLQFEGLDVSINQGTATISPDGKYLYFTQWKKGANTSPAAIYFSVKTDGGWSQPALLHTVHMDGFSSQQPFCSSDGQYLFFASDRTGGHGNFDIWYAPLSKDGTTGAAINAGSVINTADNEQAPFYHTTARRLVFSSDRSPGMGGLDLFTAEGTVNHWEAPQNMGYPVNSVKDDAYFFAPEQGALLTNAFISSDRGGDCCLSSYTITKQPKKKMLSGLIKDCQTGVPLADVSISVKEAKGTTTALTTGADGKYEFELTAPENSYEIFVQKASYKDQTSGLSIESSNEKAWLVDVLSNATICMEKIPVLKVENVVSVYFDFDKSQLKERGKEQLDSIYTHFLQDDKVTLQISGYTDGRGSEAYNKVLSDKRAKACADYFISKGVAAERISFASFGACCPIEMELINGRDNPDGRALNRRALINIIKE